MGEGGEKEREREVEGRRSSLCKTNNSCACFLNPGCGKTAKHKAEAVLGSRLAISLTAFALVLEFCLHRCFITMICVLLEGLLQWPISRWKLLQELSANESSRVRLMAKAWDTQTPKLVQCHSILKIPFTSYHKGILCAEANHKGGSDLP